MDAWVWAIRLFSTRSAATKACKAGHIKINGVTAKPAQPVRVGDAIRAVTPGGERIVIVTGLIAPLGVAPLAGYSIGQRLEFLLVPIAFGIGVASVPMVGMAVGAGDIVRARRVAWTAAAVSGLNLSVVGLIVWLFPDLWAGLFTTDEVVLDNTRQYLHWAGLAFGLFGVGLTLYFASQGSGRVLGPVLSASVRLALVAVAGFWLRAHQAPAWHYFALVGLAMAVYGLSTALSVRLTRWGPKSPLRATAPAIKPT